MLRRVCFLWLAGWLGLLAGDELIGGALKSGLQVGERSAVFQVRDCTGPAAGKTLCYCCRYGRRPVISLFVTELDESVTHLIEELDDLAARHRDLRLATFVVYLTDKPFAAEKELKSLVKTHPIRRTPLTIYRDTARVLTEDLRISPDAGVTAVMWVDGEVRANFAFPKRAFDKPDVQTIREKCEQILAKLAANE